MYNPREYGADCENCPLSCAKPVPPSPPKRRERLVVCAEAPGHNEEVEGAPLVGPSGFHLYMHLKQLGVHLYDEVSKHNALACMPKRKLSAAEWSQALAACRPRLVHELQGASSVVALGARALQSLSGKAILSDWQGAPLPGVKGLEHLQVIGAPHPSFIISRNPHLGKALAVYLERALRLHSERLPAWEWPELETVAENRQKQILALLRDAGEPVSVDIETTRRTKQTCEMTCVGFSNTKWGCSIAYPWSAEVEALVQDIFTWTRVSLCFQNGFGFDLPILERHGYQAFGRIDDTMILHATRYPRMPHDLGFISTMYHDAPRWKSPARASLAAEMEYNARDAYMTAINRVAIDRELPDLHNGRALYEEQLELAEVGRKMGRFGCYPNTTEFDTLRGQIEEQRAYYRDRFGRAAPGWDMGAVGTNPRLRKLFFEELNVAPSAYSDAGTPRLDATTLARTVAGTNLRAKHAALAVLGFRRWSKLQSTYVDGIEIAADGLVHPTWKPWVPRTGRWSCAEPNMTNIPKARKKRLEDGTVVEVTPSLLPLFRARGEGWIVGADYSQLELRIIALLSGDATLFRLYEEGADVHAYTAEHTLKFPTPIAPQDRDLTKRVEYNFNYNFSSDVTTVWRSIVTDIPNVTIPQLQKARKAWFKDHTAIRYWQMGTVARAEEYGYVEELLSGRRQYYPDKRIDANEVLNFPVQGMAGTLLNRAILKVAELVDWRRTGIIIQQHDAIYLEGPDPEELAEILVRCMEQEVSHGGNTMKFPVDVSKYKVWGRKV